MNANGPSLLQVATETWTKHFADEFETMGFSPAETVLAVHDCEWAFMRKETVDPVRAQEVFLAAKTRVEANRRPGMSKGPPKTT